MTTNTNDVNWHGGGKNEPTMGEVVCPVDGCGASFRNHFELIAHLITAHSIKSDIAQVGAVTDVQMSDWICSQCQKDCGSRVGYIMHIVNCNPGAAPNLEMTWEDLLDEIERKPHLGWPWDGGDQTDEDQGSTDDDPEPTETEEGGDDDGRSNDELDELAFLGATLHNLRSGRVQPVVRLTAEQMSEFDEERIGAGICEAPYLY